MANKPPKLEYIFSICDCPKLDIITCDGIEGERLYYRSLRMSDGKVLSDLVRDFTGTRIFLRKNEGTIPELKEKGYSLEEIFPYLIEESWWIEPFKISYE